MVMESPIRQRGGDYVDGRRVRELYRYFQPERTLHPQRGQAPSTDDSLPNATPAIPAASDSLHHSPPLPAFSAKVTPSLGLLPEALVLGEYNATLTSFAQLAALRLNVERVLISVSDRASQFILAQSSQDLFGANIMKEYESCGGLWDGCSTVSSAAWSMCKTTVDLPPSNKEKGQYSIFEINDLSDDDRYKNLPIVQDDPRFRFYAGTPLTTETNINIGCFFILDTKPRNGLTDAEKETLGSLGYLIMNFLKVSRQASEGRRAARLSRGLSCFVEGSSSFVDSTHHSYAGSSIPAPSTPSSSSHRTHHLSVSSMNSSEAPSKRSHSSDVCSSSSISDFKADPGISSGPATPLPEWWTGSRNKELKGLDESQGSSWSFRRAANLIRESLELDVDGGVIFLEAGHTPATDIDSGSEYSGENNNPAPVLAISTNDEPFAPGPGSTVLCPAANLDSGFLQQLLHRYSKGKLWSFHRDGSLSSSDDDEKTQYRRSRSRSSKNPEFAKNGPKRWKSVENSMLNLYFPNANQVLFVPLWNAANSQWFAGCFCWNTVETRVFSPSVELSSVLGFGSSIMVEHSRVESLISDRQKGDFIGSISHELRSPLHGILAAAEFLNGTQLEEFQGSLLETINACGRTLLDTMNQVLDFSKIVSLERKSRQLKRKNKYSALDMKAKFSAHLDTYVATDLALLAEEVVEGVCLGHTYSQKSVLYNQMGSFATSLPKFGHGNCTLPQLDVEVIMDIAQNDWIYQTQPGALRRIIMNVFGNAMKYTEAGRVSLRLEVAESSEGRSRKQGAEDLVTLTVSDTGKGISEEFLRGRLYTPFAQEDTLAVGTGLGLSIVRSLVKTMNGSINIHSRPGEGTIVRVSLPLARPELGVENITTSPTELRQQVENGVVNDCHLLRNTHANRRAAILGVESADAGKHGVWSVISRYLTDWFGMELVSWPSQAPVDILLADETGLDDNLSRNTTAPLPALLILCDKVVDYSTAQSQWSSLAETVSITRRPCGPYKLARTIRKCLDSQIGIKPRQCLIDLPERPRRKDTLLSQSNTPSEGEIPDVPSDTPYLTDATTTSTASDSIKSTPSQSTSDMADPLSAIISPSSLPEYPPLSSPIDPKKPDRRPRVLVVDDNSINLNLMLTFMKRRALATLDSAENGKLAVDSVEKFNERYDLIFMDMSMPVMNGFEATRAIRAIEKERGEDFSTAAIIIALTGLSSTRDESEALASGVDLFLTKPVSFKEVSKLIDEWEDHSLKEPRSNKDIYEHLPEDGV